MVELVPNTRSLITGGDAEIDAYLGLGDPAFIQTIDPIAGMANASVPANNNLLARGPRLHADATITTLVCHLGAAAGDITMAVYTSDDGGANLTRVATTGAVAAVIGLNANPLTASFTWEAGRDYWFDYFVTDATCTPWRGSGGSTVINGRGKRSIGATEVTAAPATLTWNNNQGSVIWMRAE